jgi:hypothetical protein
LLVWSFFGCAFIGARNVVRIWCGGIVGRDSAARFGKLLRDVALRNWGVFE